MTQPINLKLLSPPPWPPPPHPLQPPHHLPPPSTRIMATTTITVTIQPKQQNPKFYRLQIFSFLIPSFSNPLGHVWFQGKKKKTWIFFFFFHIWFMLNKIIFSFFILPWKYKRKLNIMEENKWHGFGEMYKYNLFIWSLFFSFILIFFSSIFPQIFRNKHNFKKFQLFRP